MPIDNAFNLKQSDAAPFSFNTGQILTHFINLLNPSNTNAEIALKLADIDNKLAQTARDIENPLPPIISILKTLLNSPPPPKGSKALELLTRLNAVENSNMTNINLRQEDLKKTLAAQIQQFNSLSTSLSGISLSDLANLKDALQKFNENKVSPFKEQVQEISKTVEQIKVETALSTGKTVTVAQAEEQITPKPQ